MTNPPDLKMTTDIPASITTPDKVATSIGTFEFFDGVPTVQSTEMAYDFLDKANAYKAIRRATSATRSACSSRSG